MVPDEEKKYFIVARRAKQSLYYSMAQNNDEKADKTVEISESRREISLELAASIHRAWTRMLLQTALSSRSSTWPRRHDAAVLGLGEGSAHFMGNPGAQGKGLLPKLAALGQALVDFTRNVSSVEAAPLTQRLHDFEAKVAGLQRR